MGLTVTFALTVVLTAIGWALFAWLSTRSRGTQHLSHPPPPRLSAVSDAPDKNAPTARSKRNTVARRAKNGGDAKRGKTKGLISKIPSHSKKIVAVALSSDGSKVAIATLESRVYSYAVRSLLPEKTTRYHLIKDLAGERVTDLSFHANGKVLACACSQSMMLGFCTVPSLRSSNEKQKHRAEHVTDRDIQTGHAEGTLIVRFASTGVKPYLVTISRHSADTTLRFFNAKGKQLAVINTNHIRLFDISVSADSQFVAVSSFMSEVVFYQFQRHKKTNLFQSVKKVMTVQHEGSVRSVAYGFFPLGTHRCVTASSVDGTVRCWDTDVRYKYRENPKLLASLTCPDVRVAALSPAADTVAMVRLSREGDHAELCFYRLTPTSTLPRIVPLNIVVLDDRDPTSRWFLEFLPDGSAVVLSTPGSRHAQVIDATDRDLC